MRVVKWFYDFLELAFGGFGDGEEVGLLSTGGSLIELLKYFSGDD